MFRSLRDILGRRRPTIRTVGKARFASSSHTKEQFNEPSGYLFGRMPGKKWPIDAVDKIYVIFYLGGLAMFVFLYQYKPDTDPYKWARREAMKRMKERGVNLEDYRYNLPKVY